MTWNEKEDMDVCEVSKKKYKIFSFHLYFLSIIISCYLNWLFFLQFVFSDEELDWVMSELNLTDIEVNHNKYISYLSLLNWNY